MGSCWRVCSNFKLIHDWRPQWSNIHYVLFNSISAYALWANLMTLRLNLSCARRWLTYPIGGVSVIVWTNGSTKYCALPTPADSNKEIKLAACPFDFYKVSWWHLWAGLKTWKHSLFLVSLHFICFLSFKIMKKKIKSRNLKLTANKCNWNWNILKLLVWMNHY